MSYQKKSGFTLIELMIVMSIVALLMSMVGPLAINSLEKAQAKQEMLSFKNWLKKISARSFNTGQHHRVEIEGNRVSVYLDGDEQPIQSNTFQTLFMKPQTLHYNNKGFVDLDSLSVTYRGELLTIELWRWINNEEKSEGFLSKSP